MTSPSCCNSRLPMQSHLHTWLYGLWSSQQAADPTHPTHNRTQSLYLPCPHRPNRQQQQQNLSRKPHWLPGRSPQPPTGSQQHTPSAVLSKAERQQHSPRTLQSHLGCSPVQLLSALDQPQSQQCCPLLHKLVNNLHSAPTTKPASRPRRNGHLTNSLVHHSRAKQVASAWPQLLLLLPGAAASMVLLPPTTSSTSQPRV